MPVERALLVLHLLTEGCAVRAIERITGTEKRTILRLLVQVGQGCERLLPELVAGAAVKDVQADEVWGYVRCKEKTKERRKITDPEAGDAYCFIGVLSRLSCVAYSSILSVVRNERKEHVMRTARITAVLLAVFLLTSMAALAGPQPKGPQSPKAPEASLSCAAKTLDGALPASLFAQISRVPASPAGFTPSPIFTSNTCPTGCTYYDGGCQTCPLHMCQVCDIYQCPDGSLHYCNCGRCQSTPCVC